MTSGPERREYHPERENVPLSVAVGEAVEAHGRTNLQEDEFDLNDHVDPAAIDTLFRGSSDVEVTVQIHHSNVIVSIWRNDAIDIRVTDDLETLLGG